MLLAAKRSPFDVIFESGLFHSTHYMAQVPGLSGSTEDLVRHYVKIGSKQGYRPAPDFDPRDYLAANPDVAAAGVEPFVHYIEHGRQEGRPTSKKLRLAYDAIREIRASGEFDYAFYMARYPEVTQLGLDPVEHYVLIGSAQGFYPCRNFNPVIYASLNPDVAAAAIEPFFHYISSGRSEGREGSLDITKKWEDRKLVEASDLFDAEFYTASFYKFPRGLDPLDHYLFVGYRYHIDPSAEFDTAFYVSQVPDVLYRGEVALVHYLRVGRGRKLLIRSDGRKPTWAVETRRADDDVHIERMRAVSLTFRFGLDREEDRLARSIIGVRALACTTPTAPTVTSGERVASIIIPVYGQLPYALHCLDSLSRHMSRYAFEIIVLDDASPDEMQTRCLATIPWIRYIRLDKNKGFLNACNEAVDHAKAAYVILLNSDTRVCAGWLDELIDTFADRPDVGLVGSKLYNDDGTLQEAGGIVWDDGSAWNFGRDDDPNRSQYCYARRADYCSGAAIALRTEFWRSLGGFDRHFEPAYYEDVDLAFRVRAAGQEVWFQPLAKVIHSEGKTHGRDETSGVKAYQVVNAQKFRIRWQDALQSHRPNGHLPLLEADRSRSKRMLALDAVTPTPDQDAGSVMTFKFLQMFEKLGWHVSFQALHDSRYSQRYTADLQRAGIETFVAPDLNTIDRVIETQPEFDAILAFRVTTLADILEKLRTSYPSALLLFHDIDLHYLRMQREADLTGNLALRRKAELTQWNEFKLVANVDCTVVPSVVEEEILKRELSVDNVIVYPYTADIVKTRDDYDARRNLMFVGGFRHGPNVDAMLYFAQQIWPHLKERLPADAKMYIVGPDAPESVRALGDDRIIVTGFLDSLEPVAATCRVFVAPLRFGAGLKGKVVTALAHGLPCVASSIAVEGMNLTAGKEVLVADEPKEFVEAILKIYENKTLWRDLRRAGLTFAEQKYSWDAGMKLAEQVLDTANRTWLHRERLKREKWLVERHQTQEDETCAAQE